MVAPRAAGIFMKRHIQTPVQPVLHFPMAASPAATSSRNSAFLPSRSQPSAIEGLVFNVTAKNGKLYWREAGFEGPGRRYGRFLDKNGILRAMLFPPISSG